MIAVAPRFITVEEIAADLGIARATAYRLAARIPRGRCRRSGGGGGAGASDISPAAR